MGKFAASFAQERIWFLHRLALTGSAYNITMSLRVAGALDIGALEKAFAELIRRPIEFRSGLHGTLHDAIQFRERHADFLSLWKSIQQHRHIPMTFDGSNPHLAFGDHPPRLEIGAKYHIPSADGTSNVGILEDATVDTVRRNVCGIYRTDDGQRVICTTSMTEAEWRAYEEHPDTFFGVIKHQGSVKDPLERYDSFLESYGGQSKERLLKLLADFGSPDVEALAALPRGELAKVYCERLVNATMATARS